MPDAINYCDSCNKIILPSHIQNGDAVVTTETSLCTDCLRSLDDDSRKKLKRLGSGRLAVETGGAQGGSKEHGTKRSVPTVGVPQRTSHMPKVLAVFAAVAGMLTGIAAVLVFTSGSGEERKAGGEKRPLANVGPGAAPVAPAAAPVESSAAQKLAEIAAMRTPELANYIELREMLEEFARFFKDSPEASRAKALLAEIDVQYGTLAETYLAEAVAKAETLGAQGKFDEAADAIDAILEKCANTPWLTDTGEAKISMARDQLAVKRAEWEIKNAARILEEARAEFTAGRLEEAEERIAKRTKWPEDVRAKADGLALEIQQRRAVIAERKRIEAEREKALAEFDRLMWTGEYAAAKTHAESAAHNDSQNELLRVATLVAAVLADFPAARIRGAQKLIGQEVRLKLIKDSRTVIVKGANDAGIDAAAPYLINNQKRERPVKLPWHQIDPTESARLARQGGLNTPPALDAFVTTYRALEANDMTKAVEAVKQAAGRPFGKRLARVVDERARQIAYETAMELAEEYIEKKKWNEAARECAKALELKPGDTKVTELRLRVRTYLEPRPEITVVVKDGVKMDLVYIRPGTFVMGGTRSKRVHHWHGTNVPKHEVVITKGFYMGKFEVTQTQYEALMEKNPSKFGGPDCPVDSVPRKDAPAFFKKLSALIGREARLPTEAEWEYASRAGSTTDWSCGESKALGEYAWFKANSGGNTHPVGQKKPNAWGLHDMYGNVSEWVRDRYDSGYYASSPREDPPGSSTGGQYIDRGGSFADGPGYANSVYRSTPRFDPHKNNKVGIRVVMPVIDADIGPMGPEEQK